MSEVTNKETGKKGNVLKVIIIVLLAAVLVGGGTFGGYYVSTKLNSQKTKINVVKSEVVNKRTFALDEFLVNLKAENAQRFIKAKIFVGYAGEKQDKKFEEELTDKKAILRDNINSILRNKKPEEFTDSGIQKMKEEIKQKINPFLKKGEITDIYFSDILVQ
ncbi:flagellar basal body-associated FliL family protein [Clostridium brassicae]|uniref:Flagellar protein FliL n=1 Tax=Clostridium brassicae TaxID=2999072 RepID=A0ABT4DBC9_9CLOT|nr:flagellar basal body-associated FliL family protein [Clostridium brassicae]MCY6959610.1 flagellar basal body-associated FliL family protein [Clostridium brassicae]